MTAEIHTNLRALCEGYAETRLVSIEKYNNLPGYTPLAQIGASRMLIGRKKDDVVEDLRKQNEELLKRATELEEKYRKEECRAISAAGCLKSLEAKVKEQESYLKVLQTTNIQLARFNQLYEQDIGKIRQAVGQIYMDKILGLKTTPAPEKSGIAAAFLQATTSTNSTDKQFYLTCSPPTLNDFVAELREAHEAHQWQVRHGFDF